MNQIKLFIGEMVKKWEFYLFLFFCLIVIFFSTVSPYFLDYFNLMNALFSFMERGIVALPVILVILSGEIDVSLASIIALSSMSMGLGAEAGAPVFVIILLGLITGIAAGFINGIIITRLDIPAIAVTIGTMSLFRGISNAVLGAEAITSYPAEFKWIGNATVGNTLIPLPFVVFVILASFVGVLLHKTKFGRSIFVIGNNRDVATFSGIRTRNIKLLVFMMTGLFCGIAAVFLTSRIASTRPNIAIGWELEIITSVVLGGIAITGGKGHIGGVLIAIFLLGYLKFGLGLLNVQGKIVIIFVGFLLILAIWLPERLRTYQESRKYRKVTTT